jgi:uncharacterized protein YecA (UPF0149 family)
VLIKSLEKGLKVMTKSLETGLEVPTKNLETVPVVMKESLEIWINESTRKQTTSAENVIRHLQVQILQLKHAEIKDLSEHKVEIKGLRLQFLSPKIVTSFQQYMGTMSWQISTQEFIWKLRETFK